MDLRLYLFLSEPLYYVWPRYSCTCTVLLEEKCTVTLLSARVINSFFLYRSSTQTAEHFGGKKRWSKLHFMSTKRLTNWSWKLKYGAFCATCCSALLYVFLCLCLQNLYTAELEGGNRGKAMQRLRVPPLNEQVSSKWCYRFLKEWLSDSLLLKPAQKIIVNIAIT